MTGLPVITAVALATLLVAGTSLMAEDHLILELTADGHPDVTRSNDGLPVFRLTREDPVERTDEWFHANLSHLDAILEYAKRQVRIPSGMRLNPARDFIERLTFFITPPQDDANLFMSLGLAFDYCGDRRNAIRHALRAVHLDPNNRDFCHNLAVLYVTGRKGDTDADSARIWYNRSIWLGAERDLDLEKLIHEANP